MAALPCVAVQGQQRTKPGSASIIRNNGSQRHIAALIITPYGKMPAHNYFKMQTNGVIIV